MAHTSGALRLGGFAGSTRVSITLSMVLLMSANSKWTAADVPDQTGRVAIVTGSNTGLGYETALVLADRGARVVLAVRDTEKGKAAAARIVGASPRADVTVQPLDLGSLQSIRTAAEELKAAYPRIDLLINNAGVMYASPRQTTKDGFELQFGTNHLGHFALTGLLLENLLPVDGFPRGDGQQRRRTGSGRHPLRRPAVGAQLQPRRGLRPVQARQPDVHLRASAQARRARTSRRSRWPRIPASPTPN